MRDNPLPQAGKVYHPTNTVMWYHPHQQTIKVDPSSVLGTSLSVSVQKFELYNLEPLWSGNATFFYLLSLPGQSEASSYIVTPRSHFPRSGVSPLCQGPNSTTPTHLLPGVQGGSGSDDVLRCPCLRGPSDHPRANFRKPLQGEEILLCSPLKGEREWEGGYSRYTHLTNSHKHARDDNMTWWHFHAHPQCPPNIRKQFSNTVYLLKVSWNNCSLTSIVKKIYI